MSSPMETRYEMFFGRMTDVCSRFDNQETIYCVADVPNVTSPYLSVQSCQWRGHAALAKQNLHQTTIGLVFTIRKVSAERLHRDGYLQVLYSSHSSNRPSSRVRRRDFELG